MSAELEIFDESMTAIGLLDAFSYSEFEKRFYSAGGFKLKTAATEGRLSLLKSGRYIRFGDDFGVINKLSIDGDEISLTGKEMKYILYKKLIRYYGALSGSAELSMRGLVKAVLGDEITLGELCNAAAEYSGYAAYYDLYDMLIMIASSAKIGFAVGIAGGKPVFSCFESRDRRREAVFCEDYDSLTAARYLLDTGCEVNSVTARYVGDYGQMSVTVDPFGAAGLRRNEICIEGGCVTKTQVVDGVAERVMDVAATEFILRQTAYKRLCGIKEEFRGSAEGSGSMSYGRDYLVGDIVTIRSRLPDIDDAFRITAVKEIYDGGRRRIVPEFSLLSQESEI